MYLILNLLLILFNMIGCSYVYIIIRDLLMFYFYLRPYKFYNLSSHYNPGLIIGAIIGSIYCYYDKPLIYLLCGAFSY